MKKITLFLFIYYCFCSLPILIAQSSQSSNKIAITDLLRSDGTLDPKQEQNGSIDFSGFQMTTDETGQPIFRASEEDCYWEGFGGVCGIDGIIHAMAVVSNELYIGGGFRLICNQPIKNIAKWNGSQWESIEENIFDNQQTSVITDFAVIGTDLYVSGDFHISINGKRFNIVAKWDDNEWTDLGIGANEIAFDALTMEVIGTDLYVGGIFSTIGGINANRIARWDGSNWSALGNGIPNSEF